MGNYFLYVSACICQILSGIKVIRMSEHMLSDPCRKAETQIGINVDLTYGRLGSLAKHIFRNTDCVIKLTAISINDIYILGQYRRSSVKHDRESGKPSGYFLQNIKAKLRLLAGFEFVCAMACSDCDCQGINACPVHKILNLIRLCIGFGTMFHLNVILNAC